MATVASTSSAKTSVSAKWADLVTKGKEVKTTARSQQGKNVKTTARSYEQIQRFILLTNILNKAGLSVNEVRECLKKYVNFLTPDDLMELATHLPGLESIDGMDLPYVTAIASLSMGKMTAETVIETAVRAKLRFVDKPALAYGEKGWLRHLLHALAQDSSRQHGVQAEAWFGKPDCALWLAFMARFRVLLSEEEWCVYLSPSVRDAYRDGWLGVFDLERSARRSAPAPSSGPVTPAWSGLLKANPRIQNPPARVQPPAAVITTPFLTTKFFSLQMQSPLYLSLVKKVPASVRQRSNELRHQLRLPQMAYKPQKGGISARGRRGNQAEQRTAGDRDSEASGEVGKPVDETEEGWTVVKNRKQKAASR
ncbi:uncharacterized protein B0H64DRAFT_49935 [Chaetomium fimeti]|uniref:Uncharacterized protein n=1 Tax=Chaetomium fimeti TaxID=1854472 RepID=A0AAE0LN29_9PEZI|nr:hypothetical protein B0H64DRAFT_49935 [Chaetomium fimeti]